MPRPAPRRFRIIDAMVLVVATALALAAIRAEWVDGVIADFGPGGEAYPLDFPNLMHRVCCLVSTISFLPAAWSVACLGLGLRRPRPPLRRTFRRPGMAAFLVAAVVLPLQMINLLLSLATNLIWFPGPEGPFLLRVAHQIRFLDEPRMIPSIIGCAIAATWTIQAITGRWRPTPDWLDRAGRALGLWWIVTIPFSWF